MISKNVSIYKGVIILALALALVLLAPRITARADPADTWLLRGDAASCSIVFPYWVTPSSWGIVEFPGELEHGVNNDNYYLSHCHLDIPLGEVWNGYHLFTLAEVCDNIPIWDQCNGNGSFVMNGSEGFDCILSDLGGIVTTDGSLTIAADGEAMFYCRYKYE